MLFRIADLFEISILFSLQFFNPVFHTFDVKLKLMLNPNMFSDVRFQTLHYFLVNFWRSSDGSEMRIALTLHFGFVFFLIIPFLGRFTQIFSLLLKNFKFI
jgi:hypothetical protein